MADEEKKVESETAQQDSETSESKEKSKEEGEHIDYKSLYEEESAKRKKAESIIQRHSEKKRDEEEEEEGDENRSSIDPEEVRNIIREEITPIVSELRRDKIDEAIKKVAVDSSHAQLIRYHYDNSVRQTGDMELDIENSVALADKRRTKQQVEELKATLASKDMRSSSASQSGQKQRSDEDETLPSMTAVDRQTVDVLREKYVISNAAIRRILKGERLDDLLTQGVIKKR